MIRMLDHTADVGFELEAAMLAELFEEARRALLAVMMQCPPQSGSQQRRVQLSAPDLEILLVRWLNELIHLIQEEELVPTGPGPGVTEGGELEVELSCAPLDVEEHGWCGEVKGATFHGLEVRRGERGWGARVILDV